MDIYETEHEQVEAIKAWWGRYGTLTIIVLAAVLAAVFGWRKWVEHGHQEADAASAEYMNMMTVVRSQPDKAMEIGRQLVSAHASSTYASMASLSMASINVEKGDKDGAAANLRWVMEKGKQAELKEIARLRLGRLLLDMGKANEALTIAQQSHNPSFQAPFDELRGDVLLFQGKRAEARTAYANALAGYSDEPAKQSLLQMKIDDLADAKSTHS